MNPRFRKDGIVQVGTIDPNQTINLNNPEGEVVEINFNLKTQTVSMVIRAWDNLNEVSREYPIELDLTAWQAFYLQFFVPHIRRLSKDQYDEFKDLIELTA